MTIKWGVIGAGGIARRRTIPEVIQYAQNSVIKAVMDPNPQSLAEIQKEFNLEAAFTTLEEILKEDLDAVYIASPVFAHFEQAVQSLQAGKNVLCEKPLSLSIREGEEMAEIAEKKKLKLGIAFMMRFNVYHQKIKTLIDDHQLGKIVAARAQLTCWYPPIQNAWRQIPQLSGGGALADMGCHCLDLLEYFLGNITATVGFLDTTVHPYQVEDTANVILKFESEAQAMVDNYFNVPDKAANNLLEIYGTKGAILTKNTIGQDPGGTMWLYQEKEEKNYDAQQSRKEISYQLVELKPSPLYAQEIDAFSQWINTGVKPKPDLSAAIGIRNLKVLDSIYRSAKEKKVVEVTK